MSENEMQKNASIDQKNNVHKLYRYAQQLVQRLDMQLQNATEWKEFFESETILTRQKLKDVCEQMLFNGTVDLARRIEDVLWRKAFYDIIQKLRQDKKTLQSSPVLVALYSAHLNAAHSFYHQLLIKITDHYNLPVPSSLDWLNALQHDKRRTADFAQKKCSKDSIEWAIRACQRCLLYLGDIARYSMDLEGNSALDLAERFYHQAIWVNPENGMPHNQLGTLKQQASFSSCEVAYHYMRCLASTASFDGAEENLKRTFERNKWLKKEMLQKLESERVDEIENFLIEFLELQEHFRYERLSPAEFSKICQSVIEKFTDALGLFVWKDVETEGTLKDLHKNLQIYGERRVNGSLMVKIFVICIITVSDLFEKDSKVVSAAVAFTFTMLSKLLDYITKTLSDSPLSAGEQASGASSSLVDSDSALCNGNKDGNFKMKKQRDRLRRNYRRRRRRRRVSSENEDSGENHEDDLGSDLSEGELGSTITSSSEDSTDDDGSEDSILLSSISQKRREEDRQKIQNLCHIGQHLSAKIQESSFSEASPGYPKRDALWNDGVGSDVASDTSLDLALSYFSEFSYLHTMKVVTDWLKYAGDKMGIFEKDLSCVWQKVARTLNELPQHHLLLTGILQYSKRRRSVLCLEDLKLPAQEQLKALPEDKALIGLPVLVPFHKTLDYEWDMRTADASILQFVFRIQSLKAFGNYLSGKVRQFTCSKENESFGFVNDVSNGPYPPNHATKEAEPKSMDGPSPVRQLERTSMTNGKSQTDFMKALAKQKLMHEVTELEEKMNSSGAPETSNLPPYLIVDSQALCRHLSLIRSLGKSREFIIIVPSQVVQALDELKRYNPSAREAIKFLEEEFRQRSKWLRSQRDEESRDVDFNRSSKKKKNLAIEEWRFHQIVKCAAYFASKLSKAELVSIVTSRLSNETSGSLGTRATQDALEACRKLGIEVEPLVDFYQRWVAKKNT
ncbi:nonsense-mediated mRNA decay factor SMG5-like isoform X2 [Rhopilema esculentum]|uniref:nonsense-mediated mRNA decay factor SMG5-like isoform X2 n=1 Tax=Rhopilema esculentum TaxID=499914 RepID=UPI0031DB1C0C